MKNIFSLLFIFLFWGNSAFGATKLFTGPGNFSDATKWNSGSLPGIGDILHINGACTFDNAASNLAYGNLVIGNTAIGSIVWPVGGTNTLSVVNVSSSFSGADALNMTNGGTLIIRGTWSANNCTFTSGTGTIEIQSVLTLPNAAGYTTFNNLAITGTVTLSRAITINGNLINNGTFTNAGFGVTFSGTTSSTVTGTAASTAFKSITVNKGASQANIIDIQCIITLNDGGLILTNGTFELSSASTIVPFTSDPNIPSTARLWCNGGTINSTASFSWSLSGTLQVSAGTVNFGFALGDRISPQINSATINISGGTLNVTGRISNGTQGWTYIMTGGVLNLSTIGSNTANIDVFNMDNSTCSFSMSGGTMIINNKGGATGENSGYHNFGSAGAGFTGGTLQIGGSFTASGGPYYIKVESDIPIFNLTVNASNVIAVLNGEHPTGPPVIANTTSISVANDVTISAGSLSAGPGPTVGDVSQDLFVGRNWTNNGTFIPGTKTVTLNGSATQNIQGSVSTTFYNLTENKSSGAANLQIATQVGNGTAGVMNFQAGELYLNTYKLTIQNPATTAVTRTSGYAVSETNSSVNTSIIQWNITTAANTGAYIFPFGVSGSYLPFTFNKTSTVNATNVSVATRATSVTNNTPWAGTVSQMYDPILATDGSVQVVIDRWWEITCTAATTATLSFSYRGSENTLTAPYNTGNLGAKYWASQWLPSNNVIGSAPAVSIPIGSLTATGISFASNTYTPLILSTTTAPLPVELIRFSASCNGDAHELLNWSTASETNNNYFEVERSDDGNAFQDIGRIEGNGTSSQMNDYSFVDPTPVAGTVYYRLRQTDYNGQFSNSAIISAESCAGSSDNFTSYYSGNAVEVVMNLSSANNYKITIIDSRGRVISSKDVSASEGSNKFEFNDGIASSGIYLITVIGENGKSFSSRVMINKE